MRNYLFSQPLRVASPQTADGIARNQRTGAISELRVAMDCLARGYRVFLPMHHDFGADLVVVRGKERWLIQVKTAPSQRNVVWRTNRRDAADVLAVVYADGQIEYEPSIIT